MLSTSQAPQANLQFLRQGDKGFVAVPRPGGRPGEVYPLCPVPSSLTDWIISASEAFWLEHQRCIAFALLFHPVLQHWSVELPQQRCLATGSEWTPGRVARPPELAGYFLAGSFQSQPGTVEALQSPMFPGLHFVLGLAHGPMLLHAQIRWNEPEGHCESLTTHLLIQNDIDRTLELAAPRMTLL